MLSLPLPGTVYAPLARSDVMVEVIRTIGEFIPEVEAVNLRDNRQVQIQNSQEKQRRFIIIC